MTPFSVFRSSNGLFFLSEISSSSVRSPALDKAFSAFSFYISCLLSFSEEVVTYFTNRLKTTDFLMLRSFL